MASLQHSVMTDDNRPRSKVDRLIREYGIEGVGVELEARWTRENDRWSLRELADWFNQRLLEQALSDAGFQTVDGEVTNNYRVLTDDDVSQGDRVQLRRRLEQAGADVDGLLDDFVSYQAIRTYLTEVRDATYDRETTTREGVEQRIDRLVGRTGTVAEDQLEQLRRNDDLTLSEFRLLVDIQVYCEGCNTQFEIADLLERGGCNCPGNG